MILPRIAVVTDWPLLPKAKEELHALLLANEIPLNTVEIFSVLDSPPPRGDLKLLCCGKKEAKATMPSYNFQPVAGAGRYLHPKWLGQVVRLAGDLRRLGPFSICLAAGTLASWALLGTAKLTAIRGVPAMADLIPGLKCLPTHSLNTMLRDWSLHVIVAADINKLARERWFPELRRPQREVWTDPVLADLVTFESRFLAPADLIAFDIETGHNSITCVGFAGDPHHAICVPFFDERKPDNSFWPSAAEEKLAWLWVKHILTGPKAKLAQNGLYDIQWLWKTMGIPVVNFAQDTMLQHHALFPELPKDLGFLGSIYTDEASWKLMRKRGKEELKSDD